MTPRAVALALAGALAAAPAAAQTVQVEGGAYRIRFHSAAPGAGEALGGFAAGAQAHIAWGRVVVETSYAEGRLTADTGAALPRDLVEGSLLLAVRAVPWLVLKAGPHLRSFAAPGGTERWVLWEARVRTESAIVPGALLAHAEGWVAIASSVNVVAGAAGSHGGEAGLTLRLGQSPFWARLSYAVDRAALASSARNETVEAVYFGIGYGRR